MPANDDKNGSTKKVQLPFWPIVKTTSHALLLITAIVVTLLLLVPTMIGQLITNDPKVLPIFMQSLDITLLFCLMSFTSIFVSSLWGLFGASNHCYHPHNWLYRLHCFYTTQHFIVC